MANRHNRRPGGGVNVLTEPARNARRRGTVMETLTVDDGGSPSTTAPPAPPRPSTVVDESPARTTISPGGASRQQTWMEVSSTANTSTCTCRVYQVLNPIPDREENP